MYKIGDILEVKKSTKEGLYIIKVPTEKKSSSNVRAKFNILLKKGQHCLYCEKLLETYGEFTIDHVFPKSLGGPNNKDNKDVSCMNCNTKKGNMLLTEFIKKYDIKITKRIANYL